MKTAVIYLGQDPAFDDLAMVELNYIKEFEAAVTSRGANYVTLDRTAFYAESGGQPFDTGRLEWDGGSARVQKVLKEGNETRHYVTEVPSADSVVGRIDWDRRHARMRMHTAQHLLSGLVFQGFGARTKGNQLYVDYSHVDFVPAAFSPEDLEAMEGDFNEVVDAALPVTIYEEAREVLEGQIAEERAILELIPQSIRTLRVIKIGDRDLCPCGGTHVRNTSEIGHMRILRRRSKGKEIDRVTYELV
ncbi:MAG: alanyl-tRNA editing protein [Thermoplasmata archaeon]|nr:alanyl-tRNA editing protein [Thermoplasmata archaeon]